MASFDDLETLVPIFNLVDEDGTVVEQNVPADYPVQEGQSLVEVGSIKKFYLLPYTDIFQALIDKIKELS